MATSRGSSEQWSRNNFSAQLGKGFAWTETTWPDPKTTTLTPLAAGDDNVHRLLEWLTPLSLVLAALSCKPDLKVQPSAPNSRLALVLHGRLSGCDIQRRAVATLNNMILAGPNRAICTAPWRHMVEGRDDVRRGSTSRGPQKK